ncbi:MAG: hypothetical protein A2Z14_15385 [Chloroflexi bacterium RBG_16_48_8]|nr:MAG: hypothetical protein A2Z14_15385 [Chloroflexi bacterium RBG_16_48_8]
MGIAIRYGVSLQDLLAANPGINPTILSIDQKITIPGPEGDPASNLLPAATPIPLPFSEVTCFPTTTEKLWCISALKNHEGYPLEGVSVIISLLNEKGEGIESRTAYSPINLIPEGGTIPLSVLFPIPPSGYASVSVLPVSAYLAENIEERYLPLEIVRERDAPGEGQKIWHLAGKVLSLVEDAKTAERVSILAIALDKEGNIVGFRNLEIGSELSFGDELPFEIDVFSLGPPIEHVEILAEALISFGVE